MDYKCEKCGLKFLKFQEKANHIRWHHKTKEFHSNVSKKISEKTKLQNDKKYGEYIFEEVKCNNCDNLIKIKYRPDKKKSKYFCCRSCANSRKITKEFKENLSKKIKNKWKNGDYDNRKNQERKIFSSKNERLIVKFFKDNYPNDGWKSGGLLKFSDGSRLSRDLYSDNLKICFEYDGIWHFKDICGQLESKQKKDELLENWCIKNNYRLIRLQDEFFESIEQVQKLIYEQNEKIIKIGNLYK